MEPPATLAGLPWNGRRRPDGAVGLYGRGVTALVAIPIPPSQAAEVRRQLATAPGIADTPQGLALSVGPVSLLLSQDDDTLATAWLLSGTVTVATLTTAAGELRRTARGGVMIRTRGLTKRFGSLTAVDHVDLDVGEGDVYGFLGANGSGKTTTVRMLLGLVLATSGTVELLGRPMPKESRDVLPSVGALVEGPAAYGHLSGRTNLRLLDASGPTSGGARDRRRRVDEALEQVGLGGVGSRPVKAYSLGMRQRLGLAGGAAATAAAAGAGRAHQRP